MPLNKLAEAALYYGFTPTKSLSVTKDDVRKASALKDAWSRNASGLPWLFSQVFIEERIALLREYLEKKHGFSSPAGHARA